MFYTALGCEVVAWWLLMDLVEVALLEAYTLPFAAVALLAGMIELRQRPSARQLGGLRPGAGRGVPADHGRWCSPATRPTLREVLLLLGGVATLIFGAMRQAAGAGHRGRGGTGISAIHFTVTRVGPYYVVVPIGVILLILGASNENRRRAQERLRALRGMR